MRRLVVHVSLMLLAVASADPGAQVFSGTPQLDRSRPVPAKADVINAWRARQDAVSTFRFAWTEQQTHPKGWLANPRHPQREWANLPGLMIDRRYVVSKALAVDHGKMRYSFEFQRPEEPDGVRIVSPEGKNSGLGEGKHYVYTSVFDGQVGRVSLTAATSSLRPVVSPTTTNVDAQNLDTRPLMMAFRPLDAVMGSLLLERAVTNRVRTLYQGRSTFLLEEERDPSGWKTVLRIEPERNFLVNQILVAFEQKLIAEIDIDYALDARWGWVPNGWQVAQMLDDGSRRVLTEAKVTSYTINEPTSADEFK